MAETRGDENSDKNVSNATCAKNSVDPLLCIHDKGDAGFVWLRHLTKGIQMRKRRMTERDAASADRKQREVRVCHEAGEQEIISQVRWEADAALTS